VQVAPADLRSYEWIGRSIERHRAQIREYVGFRECTVADAEQLTAWLAEHVAQAERRPALVRDELLAHCRSERIEPPARDELIASCGPRFTRARRLRDLQREIEEGLNVGESWNGANGVLAYGKRGDIQTNRRDEQERFVLCLRILQAALVYVNTLMLQDILDEPAWAEMLTPADRRGLTPLFWMHVLPYGEVNLDMTSRLNLAQPATVALAVAR
jgi:hypothetical protein